jgi:hypothetical protein
MVTHEIVETMTQWNQEIINRGAEPMCIFVLNPNGNIDVLSHNKFTPEQIMKVCAGVADHYHKQLSANG